MKTETKNTVIKRLEKMTPAELEHFIEYLGVLRFAEDEEILRSIHKLTSKEAENYRKIFEEIVKEGSC